MEILVGRTGFVGSNLAISHNFDASFRSTDIQKAYGLSPELLVYAGLRAEKYLANQNPDEDMASVINAFENIKKINPKRLVLISTVDVYQCPIDVDENTEIVTSGLPPYGLNRHRLEKMVHESEIDSLIIRLPGLYGENIKKNFLYDLINPVPSVLNKERYEEACQLDDHVHQAYSLLPNGFYKLQSVSAVRMRELSKFFESSPFNSLYFTDSRSIYQFYPLSYLWHHISAALELKVPFLNIAVEPLGAGEVYSALFDKEYVNFLKNPVPIYDMKTKYCNVMGGERGYLFQKFFLIKDICDFVIRMKSLKEW